MILTLDLGTSTTKAVLWGDEAALATGRASVPTVHPQPGWAEQDPEHWWRAVVAACAATRRQAGPAAWSTVRAVAFAAARETFAPVDAAGRALGPGLLWSDRRATAEAAARCAAAGGVEALRQQTGVIVDAGATAAKADWLAGHRPDVVRSARWLLAPRDLVVLRLTGTAATDHTLASRTGWFTVSGVLVGDAPAALLPPVHAAAEVVGSLLAGPADELGLATALPVVLGAGDRACEVLGVGASPSIPMVSWGTTANVSLPVAESPSPLPAGLSLSAGALGGYLLECGLSAAGAAVDWLATLTGRSPRWLLEAAGQSPAGARGATATCWFHGARAPWWEPGGRAAFVGLTAAHGPGDLARALVEAVAFDAARSLELLAEGREGREGWEGWLALAAAGGGGAGELWGSILAGVTDCVVLARQPELAASAGALLVAGAALGLDVVVELPIDRRPPDPDLVQAYRRLRPDADRVAAGVLHWRAD